MAALALCEGPILGGQQRRCGAVAAQPPPLGVVPHAERQPPVLALHPIDALGRVMRVAVALRLGHLAAAPIGKALGSQEVQRRFGLAHVDVLALAGALAFLEGQQDGHGVEAHRGEVGVRAVAARRRLAGQAGQGVEAADRGGQIAVARVVAPRAGLAEQGAGDHDDAGIEGGCDLIAKAHPFDGAGREGLREHVRPADQVAERRLAFGCGDVQCDVELVGVGAVMGSGPLGIHGAVDVGRHVAQHIDLAGRLHVHYGGAVVGQHARGAGSGDHPEEIHHLDALQGQSWLV